MVMETLLNGEIISIHVPREGDDGATFTPSTSSTDFNPRPREGDDDSRLNDHKRVFDFNPRPP